MERSIISSANRRKSAEAPRSSPCAVPLALSFLEAQGSVLDRLRCVSADSLTVALSGLYANEHSEVLCVQHRRLGIGREMGYTISTKSKDLSSLSLDELIGNLKVHEMIMEKDYELAGDKKEKIKYLALKAKKESSDDETSKSRSNDEEYAMVGKMKGYVLDGEIQITSSESVRSRLDTRIKSLLSEILGAITMKKMRKRQTTTCLIAQASNKVHTNSSYYHDYNLSIDDDTLQNEYNKICELSLKIINKNKFLKNKNGLLDNEDFELKEKLKRFLKNKASDNECESCRKLHIENENHSMQAKLLVEASKFTKFENSSCSLIDMLSIEKPSGDKMGLDYNKGEAATSEIKQVKFVKSTKTKTTADGSIKMWTVPLLIKEPRNRGTV
ncbi:hypothetical protein Tco_1431122 [Tanacetum coccineum]